MDAEVLSAEKCHNPVSKNNVPFILNATVFRNAFQKCGNASNVRFDQVFAIYASIELRNRHGFASF